MTVRRQVVVVGAGMAGLSTAYLLTQQGHDVLVLEAGEGPGGRARTHPWRDGHIEAGAMYFAQGYEKLNALIDELGLADQKRLGPGFCAAIREDGRWIHADYLDPSSLRDVLQVRELPRLALGAMRLALPALRSLPRLRKLAIGDVAAGDTFECGTVGDVMGPPGIRMAALAEGMLGYRQQDISMGFVMALGVGTALSPGGLSAQTPAYLASGTGSLTGALAAHCDVEYDAQVTLVCSDDGEGYLELADGRSIRADAVVLATPADITAQVWQDSPAHTSEFLRSVRYTEVVLCYLKTNRPTTDRLPDGRQAFFELYSLSDETGRALGLGDMNWLSPTGNTLVTGAILAGDDPLKQLSDDDLAAELIAGIANVHPVVAATVEDHTVIRLPRYVPVYEPGYLKRLHAVRRSLYPGPVDLAGDYLGSPTLEGALTSAHAASGRVQEHLRRTVPATSA